MDTITAEDVCELKVPPPDVVSMQCRQPSIEGTGEIKLRRLVKEALRMRPSCIVVGEVRQEESLDLSSVVTCTTGFSDTVCRSMSAIRAASDGEGTHRLIGDS